MFNINDFTAWKIGDGSLEGKDVLCWSRKDGYYFLKAQDAKNAFFQGGIKVVGVRK